MLRYILEQLNNHSSYPYLSHLGLTNEQVLLSDKVNPNGGAIALGHPLGMSGARLALTASYEMNINKNMEYALCTMCVGVGQGISMILQRV